MKYNLIKMEDALEALIDYRGKTPRKSDFGIETLSAKSVKNGYIDYSQCYYISEEEYDRFMVRGIPKKGDILLTTEAPTVAIDKGMPIEQLQQLLGHQKIDTTLQYAKNSLSVRLYH